MKIQSLSLAVPCKCPNQCKFCVAHMDKKKYINQIEDNWRFAHLYWDDFKERLMFARDNGCNTLMITGDGEPLMNRDFLEKFGHINKGLLIPFRWIELQTSGVFLDDAYLRFLRNHVKVSVISLSISSLDSDKNAEYNGTPENLIVNIDNLCSEIKRYDFTLRLSINLTDWFESVDVEHILCTAKDLEADQVTFRQLYTSNQNTVEDKWINKHSVSNTKIKRINNYIKNHGNPMAKLPFGATKYAIQNLSVVVDNDCMNQEIKDTYKYLILRPDAKLYSRWDRKESVLF
ncbi:MAG: radical SAM protein [bacterium]